MFRKDYPTKFYTEQMEESDPYLNLKRQLPSVGELAIPRGFHDAFENIRGVHVPACPGVQFLMDRNTERSILYTAEPFYSARLRYMARHRTQLVAFTCMGGRLDVPLMLKLPPGIMRTFRNIAGR